MKAFSFGGGVQSTAALVLAAQGKIDFPLFIFANVGIDSENPATLTYVEQVAAPFASLHGIELCEVQRQYNGGSDTLMGMIERDKRTVPIPMRSADSGAPGNRSCTGRFKIQVIHKELKRRGATAKSPAVSGLGISADEWHRMRSDSGCKWARLEYPLIDLGLSRSDCVGLIEQAGLPVPGKSSCWFCPFKRIGDWKRMRRDEPALFVRAVDLEQTLGTRSVSLGRVNCFLTGRKKPLAEALGEGDQLEMFEGGCDIAGYCHV